MLGCCFRGSRSPSRCFRRGRLLSRCFRGGKSLGCCLCGSKSPNCCFRRNKSLRSETHERPAGFWLAGRFACAHKSGARKGVVGRAAGGAFAFVLGERVLLLAMNRARSAIGCHWLALAGIGWRWSWRVRIIASFGRLGDKTCDYSHGRGLVKTVWDSKLQTIVKNVQFPDAQRWFEGFLDPLIANNRSFCPRASKTHDFSRSTIAKAGAPECPRGQNQRLFADSFDFACTWGAQVLLKRWLVRC